MKKLYLFGTILVLFGLINSKIFAEENLILITVDTLRADHLGVYGYERKTSPHIDLFAKDSIVFKNQITTRPKTLPSLVSLFTGLRPNQHQVRQNNQPLDRKYQVLTSVFKNHGYKTIGVISNTVLKAEYSGLDVDFDIYDTELNYSEINRPEFLERNAEDSFQAALKYINEFKDQKFFIWIHIIDPHGPYLPPKDYQNHFKSLVPKFVPINLLPEYQILPKAPVKNELTDINYYIDSYDDEIRYTDIQFGKFIDGIKDLGLFNKSLIIFTSDHGESLDEHGYYLEHGQEVYDSSIRIPLLIKTPRENKDQIKYYESETSTIDLYPTIVNYFNFKTSKKTPGRDLFQVIKKTPVISNTVFSENFHKNNYLRLSAKKYDKKLIQRNKKNFCYDLKIDPEEIAPRSCDLKIFNELNSDLQDYIINSNNTPIKPVQVKKEDVNVLKSLGYFK